MGTGLKSAHTIRTTSGAPRRALIRRNIRGEAMGDAFKMMSTPAEGHTHGIGPQDISVLVLDSSSKRTCWDVLQKATPHGLILSLESHDQPEAVSCDTVTRLKGLEAMVVMGWLKGDVDYPARRELFYVSVSRPRSWLIQAGSARACWVAV